MAWLGMVIKELIMYKNDHYNNHRKNIRGGTHSSMKDGLSNVICSYQWTGDGKRDDQSDRRKLQRHLEKKSRRNKLKRELYNLCNEY